MDSFTSAGTPKGFSTLKQRNTNQVIHVRKVGLNHIFLHVYSEKRETKNNIYVLVKHSGCFIISNSKLTLLTLTMMQAQGNIIIKMAILCLAVNFMSLAAV